MVESLADQVVQKIKQAGELYHRFMLVVAPVGAGKTAAFQDNIEVLFDVPQKQDPLRFLQGLSRNKTVVAVWEWLH